MTAASTVAAFVALPLRLLTSAVNGRLGFRSCLTLHWSLQRTGAARQAAQPASCQKAAWEISLLVIYSFVLLRSASENPCFENTKGLLELLKVARSKSALKVQHSYRTRRHILEYLEGLLSVKAPFGVSA